MVHPINCAYYHPIMQADPHVSSNAPSLGPSGEPGHPLFDFIFSWGGSQREGCIEPDAGTWHVSFYASAFRRRRHYVFGLSVRPSVRSLKYPLFTCTWVRWSTRPTVTVLRHVRPSVRLSVCPSVRRGFRAFAVERMEGMARNFTCWCILTIFRTDKFMAMVSWFF